MRPSSGELGPLPDARLLGAGDDHDGALLLFTHQVIRVGAEPTRRTGRALVPQGPGAASDATVDEFVSELRPAFEHFLSSQASGWTGVMTS